MKNIVLMLIISAFYMQSNIAQTAPEIVSKCLTAHGGKQKIESIQYLKTSYIQHTNLVEQSERPSGPYIQDYQTGINTIDYKNERLQSLTKNQSLVYGSPDWVEGEYRYERGLLVRAFNGRWFPVGTGADYQELFDYSPAQVLHQLANATNLKLEGKQAVQGVDNWKIQVQAQNAAFTVFINCFTNMMTAVAYSSAYQAKDNFFWSFWGDYQTQVYYSSYDIVPPGILYPLQIDIIKHGWDFRSTTFTGVEINPTVSDTIFNIPSALKQAAPAQLAVSFNRMDWQTAQKEEVAPGISLYKGAWNVTFVEQKDGIVIIESPISSAYAQQAMDAARQQFPNKPIKAVITTSDAWPHFAGLRQYVAAKIPVYALDLNQPIIDKLLNANFITYPDALAKAPQKPNITWVSKKTLLKDEQLPLEIYPMRGEGGERMLMVYFPKQQILYASDLIQKNSRTGAFFMPGYLMEVKNAAAREGVMVQKVFAMHTATTDWSEVENAIQKAAGMNNE